MEEQQQVALKEEERDQQQQVVPEEHQEQQEQQQQQQQRLQCLKSSLTPAVVFVPPSWLWTELMNASCGHGVRLLVAGCIAL
jgi:hypothetical protein